MIKKKPYKGKYTPTGSALIKAKICSPPKQVERDFRWFEGLDIIYTLKDMGPAKFQEYSENFKLLAYEEGMRNNEVKYKFAKFDCKLGRLGKGKDIPDVATFQCAMHPDPEQMVWGPGYEVPQRHFLYHKVEDILDMTKRYPGKLNRQKPYKVLRLTICLREPKEVTYG